jgi:hypothetical protein
MITIALHPALLQMILVPCQSLQMRARPNMHPEVDRTAENLGGVPGVALRNRPLVSYFSRRPSFIFLFNLSTSRFQNEREQWPAAITFN